MPQASSLKPLFLLLFFWAFPGNLCGADERPLYERIAFNRITLTPEEGGETFDILPIPFPQGLPPSPQPKSGDIIIRFVEFPNEEYQISWSAIAKFQSFNDLVLEELRHKQPILLEQINALAQATANEKVDLRIAYTRDTIQKSLNSLFGYYEYLSQSRNPSAGLDSLYRSFLFGEAVYYSKVRKWIVAVTRLEQLYRLQKNFPGLHDQWNRTFNEILKETTAEKKYDQAREWMQVLDERFPGNAIAKRWTTFYTNQANRLRTESARAFEQNDYILALKKIRDAIDIYPEGPGIKETAQTLFNRFPYVIVGVSELAQGLNFDENGAYRSFSPLPLTPHTRPQRLVSRSFVEQIGFQMEGGNYQSPFGTLSTEEQGQVLKLQFRSDSSESISGYEIAESLMRFTDTTFNPVAFLWLDRIDSFEMRDPEQLTIRLSGPSILPASFFRIPIDRFPVDRASTDAEETEKEKSNESVAKMLHRSGPYILYSQETQTTENPIPKTTFLFNDRYTFRFESGPKIIQEQAVFDTKEGLQLLTQGKISALDRVAPWEVEKDPNIAKEFNVGKYAIPSVHFLVPNCDRPLPSSRTFRRALLYGMNRQRVLNQLIAETSNSDAEIISGISPKGASTVDPIGYGYDLKIVPRRYDPKLAVALCLITLTHARDRGELNESERPEKPRKYQLTDDVPEIVLAHPRNSAAIAAVQGIRREWESIGIPVQLVPYSDEEPIGRGKRVDFWYVSCQIFEPMVDIPIVFSEEGLAGTASAYMEIALNQLISAKSWPEIAKALQEIHRISYEETTVLPLWMWKDCYVFRKDILGVSDDPLFDLNASQSDSSLSRNGLFHFYQSVEYWRVPFHYTQ